MDPARMEAHVRHYLGEEQEKGTLTDEELEEYADHYLEGVDDDGIQMPEGKDAEYIAANGFDHLGTIPDINGEQEDRIRLWQRFVGLSIRTKDRSGRRMDLIPYLGTWVLHMNSKEEYRIKARQWCWTSGVRIAWLAGGRAINLLDKTTGWCSSPRDAVMSVVRNIGRKAPRRWKNEDIAEVYDIRTIIVPKEEQLPPMFKTHDGEPESSIGRSAKGGDFARIYREMEGDNAMDGQERMLFRPRNRDDFPF